MKPLKRLLFVVLLVAAGVVVTLVLKYLLADNGYILIRYREDTVEMSLWMGLFLVLLIVGGYFISKLAFSRIIRLYGGLFNWYGGRQSLATRRKITRGLIKYSEGSLARAVRLMDQSAEQSDTPLVNYLIAAKANAALGNVSESDECLRKAEERTPRAALAVGLTQAGLQMDREQHEQALATLTRLRTMSPKHPEVLRRLKEVYCALHDWPQLIQLWPELKKHKILSDAELQQLQVNVYTQLLDEGCERSQRNGGDAELVSAWRQVPATLQKELPLVQRYATALVRCKQDIEAEKVLRNTLNRSWDDSLVRIYGDVQGEDVQKQLLAAEGWVKERPNNAVLLLALGRLSLRNELWGKAREYFENSLAAEPMPETYAELGRLLASMGEHEQSTAYYQQGLSQSSIALQTLPLPAVEAAAV